MRKSEMDHTLSELYLSSFLIKQTAQKPLGVHLSCLTETEPAMSSLLLLFSCQVGDSVKIEAASHLFI